MSESSPLLRQDSEGHRSLQNRILNIFHNPGSRRASPVPNSGDDGRGTPGLGITASDEPGARTRLLESYHQSNPICGERRCSHGTFSPRPEGAERQDYSAPSSVHFGYSGNGETGAAPSHPHGGDDHPGSRPDSEDTSQMKSSFTALSMNEDKKLYANRHGFLPLVIHGRIVFVIQFWSSEG
jgi:hypothetical protein